MFMRKSGGRLVPPLCNGAASSRAVRALHGEVLLRVEPLVFQFELRDGLLQH